MHDEPKIPLPRGPSVSKPAARLLVGRATALYIGAPLGHHSRIRHELVQHRVFPP